MSWKNYLTHHSSSFHYISLLLNKVDDFPDRHLSTSNIVGYALGKFHRKNGSQIEKIISKRVRKRVKIREKKKKKEVVLVMMLSRDIQVALKPLDKPSTRHINSALILDYTLYCLNRIDPTAQLDLSSCCVFSFSPFRIEILIQN